ncbi:MAG: hypothetical protein OEY67_01455, partial [Gammaproteobacteria bacterium]|nr:hypothetical protein [Gammaproteobacteria bacterium]
STAARGAVYKHSGGVPRLINLLCDTALVYGYAEQAKVVDERIVNDVVMERGKHGMLPKFRDIAAVDDAEILDNLSEIIVESQEFEKEVSQQENEQTEMPVAASSGRGTSSLHVISGYGSNTSRRTFSNASPDNNNRAEHVTQTAEESETKITDIDKERSENDSAAAEVAKLVREGSKKDESVSTEKDFSGNIAGDHSFISQPRAETFEEFDEVIENNKNNKLSEAEDVSFREAEPSVMNRDNHVPYKSDIIPVQQPARSPASGLSVGILGFAFGLLLATVVLIFTFTRGGFNSTQEVVKKETKSSPVTEQLSQTDPNTTALESLQRERDAALAEARALQRERDAALAVAKAQQDLREAELKAEQARKREALAAAQAVNARERARAAELEAELARKRDQAKIISSESSQENVAVESAGSGLRSIEEEKTPNAVSNTPGSEFVTVQPAAPVVVVPEQITAEPTINHSINKKAESFSPDPCKGPSAVFLSTCKK